MVVYSSFSSFVFSDDGFLNTLRACAGKPQLKRLRFGRRNRLNDAKKPLCRGGVSQAHFAIYGAHFQLITICRQFAAFFL